MTKKGKRGASRGRAAGTGAGRAQKSLATLREQDRTLTLLRELSRALTSILDRDELLHSIAERVKTLVDYDLFVLMEWNEQTKVLDSVFAKHYDDTVKVRLRIPLYKGITGHAAGERRSFRVDDVRADPRYVEFPNSESVRSELVVPLLRKDKLIGVLDLESKKLKAFTAEHERLLGILASFIAIAVENSRLYSTARENEIRLQRDLDTAREVQLQLLPQKPEAVPGVEVAAAYAPARELAGDFYDFLRYGEEILAVVVGDVSGKGTAAALFGSLAIGILREHTRGRQWSAAELLPLLSRRLAASRISPEFVAVLLAIYDTTSKRITFANAGIPHPILVRGGNVQQLKIEGVPLGILPESKYDVLTLDVEPGDIVVCASDGITESRKADGTLFGFERLAEVLRKAKAEDSCEEIAAAIIKATDEFSGQPAEPHDDRTLVVLRIAENPRA